MEMIVSTQPVKDRIVEGTRVRGVDWLVNMQNGQLKAMNDLQIKFERYKEMWDHELDKNEERISTKQLQLED